MNGLLNDSLKDFCRINYISTCSISCDKPLFVQSTPEIILALPAAISMGEGLPGDFDLVGIAAICRTKNKSQIKILILTAKAQRTQRKHYFSES